MPIKDKLKRKEYHKAYIKIHYKNNKEYYRNKRKTQENRIRKLIREHKDNPCVDCGIKYPYYVMDFDHRENKKFNIGHAVNRKFGLEKVKLEIAKCDLVCANCHRERTHCPGSSTDRAADF